MADNKGVWEFVEMQKAAIYGASNDRNMDTSFEDSDDFARYVYEVYLVIERRIREHDAVKAFGIPRHGKEERVKDLARKKYEEGFESEIPHLKALYVAVPATDGNTLGSDGETERRSTFPYDGDNLY